MSKDTTFVIGTIVEAEWLNELQEVSTGLTFGLNLAQSSATVDRLATTVSGDPIDTRSSIIIGGQRRWLSGPSGDAIAGGVSGARKIIAYVDDDDDLNAGPGYPNSRDFSLEVVPIGNVASGTYSREIGYADWDSGTSTLYNIRMSNGVQADASQFNAFTFQSIGTGSGDVPVTISAKSTQDNSSSPMLRVGNDVSTYRYFIYGSGLVEMTPDSGFDVVEHTILTGDATSRFEMNGFGAHLWGDGTNPVDTYLHRPAGTPEDLRLDGPTGEGKFDTTYFQNSDLFSAPIAGSIIGANNFLSPVNFMDDIYVGAVLVDLLGLAHLDEIETFTAAHTFDATLSMATTRDFVFNGSGKIDSRLHGAASQNVLLTAVSGDLVTRFQLNADGGMTWTDGATAITGATLSWASNALLMSLGDQIQVQQNPGVDNDLARKKYVDDQDTFYADGQRAFSFFIGR